MKKKKKAYFSKTFVYLVLLIAAVAGFFLIANYATNQKLSMNSEANGSTCKQQKGDWYKAKQYNTCSQVKDKSGDKRTFTRIYPSDQSKYNDYICCVASSMTTAKSINGKDCKEAGGSKADWYKPNFSAAYSDKYIVKTIDKTGLVGSYYKKQHPDRLCLIVTMTKKPTCSSLSGRWISGGCGNSGDSYYYNATSPNGSYLSDYKQGSTCCKKGAKKTNNENIE